MDISLPVRVGGLMAILVAAVSGQSCSRFGGGSCCPDLQPIDSDLRDDDYSNQPLYFKFVADSDLARKIDNICITLFPLPDDPETFHVYYSHVQHDGQNYIISTIENQPDIGGISRVGRALCSFSDTVFAQADHSNVDPACDDVDLLYRCPLRGECPDEVITAGNIPIAGFSNICSPISRSCMNSIKSTISNNGLPDQDYYIFPNRLPSRCVFNQVCTILPVLQRFRQAVGTAFPTLGYINNLA